MRNFASLAKNLLPLRFISSSPVSASMGRRWKKKRPGHGGPGQRRDRPHRDQRPQRPNEWQDTFVKENKDFERFYKEQGIVPEGEWDQFLEGLRSPLPATFRITGYKSHAQELLRRLKGQYISQLLEVTSEDGELLEKPQPIPWYPDELAWRTNYSRKDLRRSPALAKFHDFLVTETETGNVSRQEAVSMIPPLLLDVQPHHKILDMCAAPGSKTAQLIEMLHTEDGQSFPGGFVVANDADNKRCYMLVHQAKRLNSPCFLVTNHDASHMPNMTVPAEGEEGTTGTLAYDRVLCDVPCSGDGTMRKNPDVWKKWSPGQGQNLHNLQLRIVRRGIELLRVGGQLVYSTCSLNPLEDEAVIAALLTECEDSVELVDVSDKLIGLKRLSGVSSWKVMTKKGEFYSSIEEVPTDRSTNLRRASMFPPPDPDKLNAMHLDRCIRILPHHQDTGGFFVAVLRKTKALPWTRQGKADRRREESELTGDEAKSSDTSAAPGQAGEGGVRQETGAAAEADGKGSDTGQGEGDDGKNEDEAGNSNGSEGLARPPPAKKAKLAWEGSYKEDPFVFFTEDEELWPIMRDFYQISDTFPHLQLLVRCYEGKKRTVYLVSKEVKDILTYNENSLKVINCGVRVMVRSRNDKSKTMSLFRLAQDGIPTLLPYINGRRVEIKQEDAILLLTEENPHIHKLTAEARDQLKPLEEGSIVMVYEPDMSNPEAVHCKMVFVGWRGKVTVRSFVPKNDRRHFLLLCGVDVEVRQTKRRQMALEREAKGQTANEDVEEGAGQGEEDNEEDAEEDVAMTTRSDDDDGALATTETSDTVEEETSAIESDAQSSIKE
ncbi:PREDICTED: tRNA (cytosine(34)-C(5))-methyltransferase-like [Branchiostoma belcheri]|uniref:tRNA (cytosine(34)-C(5))-methyltransferase n=1 Tax=Branchiostoma belcheri TaxID=7741 RepID=A0A6P4ZG50_BRABE|nr:PREDICTED: tRNA (cytosine(34)-C(5))-methyltransferase-like [Branchiostoma belcheri]